MASDITAPAPNRFLAPRQSFATVGRDVAAVAFTHPLRLRWWLAFAASVGLVGLLVLAIGLLLFEGVGVWGNNVPVTWALDIVSYDWWIGIASGGLLISATLMLANVEWRGALSRLTETGALIAAGAAACYPIIHLGRPWYFYWNLPYPNTFALWPQFRSPLYWDAVDIISYLVIAVTFWTIGLLPDLATLRDQATERWRDTGRGLLRAQLYGLFALGWRGSAYHWHRWAQAYRIVAVMGILLVFSLQTGAAVMFAGTVEPGWHDTLLPFAFVAGAVFGGVAFMAAAAVALRAVFRLDHLITREHLAILAWMLLGLGLANLYCYATEVFTTLLGNDSFETAVLGRRLVGPHAWAFWSIVICALFPVHIFWLPAARRSAVTLLIVGLLVSIGTFADHYMVIVVTLQHDFLPSASHPFSSDLWGVCTFAGSVGLFFALALLGLRYLPIVSILEVRRLLMDEPVETRESVNAARDTPQSIAEASPRLNGPGSQDRARGDEDEHPSSARAGTKEEAPLYAVAAEFSAGGPALAAAQALQPRGFGRVDNHSPVPVEGMADALGLGSSSMTRFGVGGVAVGFTSSMALLIYATASDYVFNIGGRPHVSWPAFVVPSVSFGLMLGALVVYLVMLFLNRLPRLNHPAFNIPGFTRITQDRHILTIEPDSHQPLDFDAIEAALDALPARPLSVARVNR